jgi:predicted nucleic acid-binding protein
LAASQLGRCVTQSTEFDSLFEEIDLIEVDDALARRAGELAEVRQPRGYDAVHLAAADRVRDPDVVVIAGDRALLDAATAEGITVAKLP